MSDWKYTSVRRNAALDAWEAKWSAEHARWDAAERARRVIEAAERRDLLPLFLGLTEEDAARIHAEHDQPEKKW